MAPRRFMGRPLRLVGSLAIAGAVGLTAAPPAWAHRDGCHAQHSCPSDSGTYVCGDTGNFSECGYGPGELDGSESDSSSGAYSAPPAPPADVTAPDAPTLGSASTRAGRVSVPVTAEAGSRIEVSDAAGHIVATDYGIGGKQTVAFRGEDGAQTYTVTATDSAGNASYGDSFSVTVDGTAPRKPTVRVSEAIGLAAYSDVVITGERGTHYVVNVSRKAGAQLEHLTQRGVLAGGEDGVRLLAPNGDYELDVLLTDASGNSSAVTTSALAVSLPAPTLKLERTSLENDASVVMQVMGPALGKGKIEFTAAGQDTITEDFALDDSGRTVLRADLPDATWAAAGAVVDFQERKATGRAGDLLVDTVAPVLLASLDRDRAEDRTIAVAFDVEPDSVVTVSGAPGGERRYDRPGRQTLVQQADDGDYRLVLVASDEAGNVSTKRLTATVTHPLTVIEGLTAMGILGALGVGAFFVIRLLWRRRNWLESWVWNLRAKQSQRRILAAHALDVANHERAVAEHQQALVEHGRDRKRWEQTASQLRDRLREAQKFDGNAGATLLVARLFGGLPVKLKDGERLYDRSDGGLVEMRKPRGGVETPTVIESGSVVVTDQRVLFVGSRKNREWSFAKSLGNSHVDATITMIPVSNRQKVSGISYPADGQVRRRLELAQASFDGRRHEIVAATEQGLKRHLERPPTPPVPPPAAPADPVLPTADDLRVNARKKGPRIPAQRSSTENRVRREATRR